MPELQVMRGGRVVSVVEVGVDPLFVGRSDTNGLVIADEDVSNHHAVLSWDGVQLRVEDLRSTNGTFVSGTRIEQATALRNGDVVRLSNDVQLRVRGLDRKPQGIPVIEDIEAGLRHRFDSDRLAIGAGRDCSIRLASGPERQAMLLFHPNGEVWLGTDDEDRQLAYDDVFAVGGRRFRLVRAAFSKGPTESAATTRYPYRLTAGLRPEGPEAELERTDGASRFHCVGNNQAVLLYLLARQQVEDRGASKGSDVRGWCDDGAVLTGIWGRSGRSMSSYYVLVHRLRKALEDAGFDPWFIEKRRGSIRARVAEASVS